MLQTRGNGTDFGDLTVEREAPANLYSSTSSLWRRNCSSNKTLSEFMVVCGVLQDFGDLTEASNYWHYLLTQRCFLENNDFVNFKCNRLYYNSFNRR